MKNVQAIIYIRLKLWNILIQVGLRAGRLDGKEIFRLLRNLAPKIAKYLESHLEQPVQSVLEIGCGSGYMGIGFQSIGCDYTGIDVDAKSIEFAKSKGINAHCTKIEDIQNSHSNVVKNYDLVISSNVFEHLDDPSKAFANLKFISRNGIIVIIVPNANGLFGRLKANKVLSKISQLIQGNNRDIAYSIDGYWHNLAYTKNTLEHLCVKEGIDIASLDFMSINNPIFGFVQPNRTLLYRIASSVAKILKMDSEIILIGRLNY
ncbi:MAG: methyltransferase domain-containing protein [Methanosarcinales archaeon]|nr:methyltransferase domain-containing protein [Methanosarcinales archaeon]